MTGSDKIDAWVDVVMREDPYESLSLFPGRPEAESYAISVNVGDENTACSTLAAATVAVERGLPRIAAMHERLYRDGESPVTFLEENLFIHQIIGSLPYSLGRGSWSTKKESLRVGMNPLVGHMVDGIDPSTIDEDTFSNDEIDTAEVVSSSLTKDIVSEKFIMNHLTLSRHQKEILLNAMYDVTNTTPTLTEVNALCSIPLIAIGCGEILTAISFGARPDLDPDGALMLWSTIPIPGAITNLTLAARASVSLWRSTFMSPSVPYPALGYLDLGTKESRELFLRSMGDHDNGSLIEAGALTSDEIDLLNMVPGELWEP